ncbi:sulfite exporter TauE/SafE family protein [Oricola thermophila]|uniref:Probable membrane transporter protein n=1 Tax=Oricola thermophila TaxID=2742145 RepID=A0A6N1VN24_9HYPH|nr:sulfite exporter TauE/SafE family protein [Oricola thermophila]QKV20599.1 sulfite exporter TauE/SafE family protein [Oricola thermophila]
MLDLAVLVLAGFVAGALNTVAGGGTFLTLPALIFVGVPPVAANATSAVAVFPGYLAGAIGFASEIRSLDRTRLAWILVASVLGGSVGSFLLLVSSNEAFSFVVPYLLALGTLTFAFGDRLRAWAVSRGGARRRGVFATFAASVYGGYFNGGLGIILLALFSLQGMRDINLMNGLKNAVSFVLAAISVAIFATAGIVSWRHAAIMAAAAVTGGYLGAPIARALPSAAVRAIVIAVGAFMTVVFFRASLS